MAMPTNLIFVKEMDKKNAKGDVIPGQRMIINVDRFVRVLPGSASRDSNVGAVIHYIDADNKAAVIEVDAAFRELVIDLAAKHYTR